MKNVLFFAFMLMAVSSNAQLSNPVKWSYSIVKVADKTFDVKVTAILDKGWHLYAQEAGEGPEPTTFSFASNPMFKLEGKVKEVGKLRKEYDPNFDSELKFYSNEVTFIQRIKMRSNVATVVNGNVNYMVCNDRKCLPPKDVPFTVKVPAK
ncbi:MAG TPA: protein-disulfide reductase DsbD family protein [Ferruginibacter sp.]|nr:protein-disulfide reductase DsbD family protein [Ferruginibacter sp.]HRO17468.1 protein-disulfide reductase DsbD family protein [Ferruginibacter sp.]HRQ21027.1 protein-disulfide reductase DsbD family protein [Ferruginibacter sp.]